MPLLYTREETNDKIVITYKYRALAYIPILLALALYAIPTSGYSIWKSALIVFLGWVYIMMAIVGFWKPSKEIRAAMKNQGVSATGKNWSLKNPITVTIEKDESVKTE